MIVLAPAEAYIREVLVLPVFLLPRESYFTDYRIEATADLTNKISVLPGRWGTSHLAFPNAYAPTTLRASDAKVGFVNLRGM